MRNQVLSTSSPSTLEAKSCNDPIVGAILSGWRYDISSISPEMRTEYESHLEVCTHCRGRQHKARFIDVLLILVTSTSMFAFLLMVLLMRRLEALAHVGASYVVHLHQTPIAISLQAVAVAGLVLSMVLCVLVAIATPLPGLVSTMVQERIPSDLRQRFARRHA